jgi:hypothetical protein
MRYERQVVLQMQPGSGVQSSTSPDAASDDVKAGASSLATVNAGKNQVKKKVDSKAKPRAVTAKSHPVGTKAPAGTTRYHPSQAVQR